MNNYNTQNMKYIFLSRHRLHSLLLTVIALGMAGMTLCSCRPGNRTAAVTAQPVDALDTVVFSRLAFSERPDSAVDCKLNADYPSGTDSLATGIRAFIAQTLAAQYLPRTNSDDGGKGYPLYSGSLDRGQQLLAHYGKGTAAYLEAQAAELRSAGMASPQLCLDLSIRKVADTGRYVTYQTSSYTYLGGAHGSATEFCTNIVKPSGKVLTQTVDTLKTKALQPLLRKGVAAYLRAQGDSSITAGNVTQSLFLPQEGIIPLPANAPYLDTDGVHFVYQQYEIGCYAMGIIHFTVPYSEIRSCLTPEALKLVGQ